MLRMHERGLSVILHRLGYNQSRGRAPQRDGAILQHRDGDSARSLENTQPLVRKTVVELMMMKIIRGMV